MVDKFEKVTKQDIIDIASKITIEKIYFWEVKIMRKITVNVSNELGEKTYTTTLDNGLKVYICKKEGFSKKNWIIWN